jgi:CPA1 family monovalent cation:H+ antiporter
MERGLVWLVRRLGLLPPLGGWSEHHQRILMMRDYQVSWARYRAASSVLRNLDEIAAESGVSADAVQAIRDCYQGLAKSLQAELEQTGELYPEFVEASQEKLGSRLLLISEQDAIGRVGALGILPDGVATAIMQDQDQRLRSLASEDLTRYLEINPTELLAKVPMFSGLDEAGFSTLARYLRMRSYPKGEHIIQQHQHGDTLFMIARGVASVTLDSPQPEEVARLYAGDVFGEAALLHGSPRNATVTAVTPCTVYELHRDEWLTICSAKPDILSAVEAVDMERSL